MNNPPLKSISRRFFQREPAVFVFIPVRITNMRVYTYSFSVKQKIMVTEDEMTVDFILHTYILNESLKQRDIRIEQLKAENRELLFLVEKLKNMLGQFAPEDISKLGLFKI